MWRNKRGKMSSFLIIFILFFFFKKEKKREQGDYCNLLFLSAAQGRRWSISIGKNCALENDNNGDNKCLLLISSAWISSWKPAKKDSSIQFRRGNWDCFFSSLFFFWSGVTKKLPKANCPKAAVIVTISSRKQLENNRAATWRDVSTRHHSAGRIKGWLNIKRESICKLTAVIRRHCLWCYPPIDSAPSIFTHLIKLKA